VLGEFLDEEIQLFSGKEREVVKEFSPVCAVPNQI
jgi:hypothetical protein